MSRKMSLSFKDLSATSLELDAATDRTSLTDKKIIFKRKKTTRKECKATGVLEKIFHRTRQPNSQYYLSQAKSVDPNNVRDVLKESTPFKYPRELEQFSFKVAQKVWHSKLIRNELRKKYYSKTNARSRQTEDLLKRLYVESPMEGAKARTIFDLDPQFYSICEGRPIDKRFSMSKFQQDLRLILRTKLMIGYRNDEVLMIDEKVIEEERIIKEVKELCKTYLQAFETFVSNDYDDAMKELRQADKEAIQTMEKNSQIKNNYKELASIEYGVYKLEERWRDLKMYQKFLYYVSPLSWRVKYDYINKLEDSASHIFQKYRLTSQGEIPPLERLVEAFLAEVHNEIEPVLYFKTTNELKKVFRFIEIQNLNCLLHTEEMAIPMENMRTTMQRARKKFETEASALQEVINGLAKNIDFEEDCAESLKNKALRLINGEFRRLIADDDILRLHVYVEDVYESCIAPNDSNFTLFEMMRAVEQYYNELALDLDRMPQHIVKKSEKARFAEEAKLAKLCKEAAAKITLVDRITWRLKKSLEPPKYRTTKPLVWRSKPPEKIIKIKKETRKPTNVETEYLQFFTDYCQFGDELSDYGIDLTVPETDLSKFSAYKVLCPDDEPEEQFAPLD